MESPTQSKKEKLQENLNKLERKNLMEKQKLIKPPKKEKLQKNLDKLERKHLMEKQKLIKPGNCMKFIKAIIDPECLSSSHGRLVLNNLAEYKVPYEIKTQAISGIITWERQTQQYLYNTEENVELTEKTENQKIVLYLIQGEEIVNLIKSNRLLSRISCIKDLYPEHIFTIVIYGLKEFCRKNRNVFKRKEFEMHVTELQISLNCSHRLLETAAEYALTVAQFSKSIAEIPFKKQRNEKFDQANFYLMNDNRDCVRVQDKHGLLRLWQQHLIKLPLATLETAQSIINEYPMPTNLIETYETELDGANLLADIPIRRTAGPLTNIRRIGPELSRKIYKLYTTTDPKQLIE